MSGRRVTLWVGVGMVAAVLVIGLAAPWLAPWDPVAQQLHRRLEGPAPGHLLGFDELGRDILSRLLHGARVSVVVSLSVVSLATVIGTVVGGVAGYLGGWADELAMRATDLFLAFPGILLAIALVGLLGPGLDNVVIALVVIGWVGSARLVRGQTLKVKSEPFVLAARAAGVPTPRILLRHLLPNVLPVLVVQASLAMAGVILAEAGLSFLGLGVQPPAPSWGSMIDAGRGHLLDAPHLALWPGLAILWTVMAFNLLGDALVDAIGPERNSVGGRRSPDGE